MAVRQHTVPRTYLRGFADPKSRLRAFDRITQRVLPIGVSDATVVNHIYDVPSNVEGLDSQAIENYLAQSEGAATSPIEKVRSGRGIVEPEDRQPLVEFLALQMTRTTRIWEEVHQLGDWYGKVWLEGISREGVRERFRDAGIEPSDHDVEEVMKFAGNLDKYRIVPPDGSFLLMFLAAYERILPFLAGGWNWLVVRSGRPFLTSDHPVVMIGDSFNGGLGVANADEIWLPVGRHHAVVLSRDDSLPGIILNVPPAHAKRVCQRIALESTRWLFWHPKDDPLEGIDVPTPGPHLRIETVGWRERDDGSIGELVNFGSNRPVITGECLLNGRPIVNLRGTLAPPWKPGKPPLPNVASEEAIRGNVV